MESNGFTTGDGYQVAVALQGSAPILQHAFTQNQLVELADQVRQRTGSPTYAYEWLTTMHISPDGYLCQPATHIEGALQKAATSFTIKGKGKKTWRDSIRAYAYVNPDSIIHLRDNQPVKAPGPELMESPTEHLQVNVMRVVVNRAAVARSRLWIAPGWELQFTIDVIDDQLPPDVLRAIVHEAGRAVGIGDYRPRYGRFQVTRFEW